MKWNVDKLKVDAIKRGQNEKLMKWNVDKFKSCWNAKMTKCKVDEIKSW